MTSPVEITCLDTQIKCEIIDDDSWTITLNLEVCTHWTISGCPWV